MSDNHERDTRLLTPGTCLGILAVAISVATTIVLLSQLIFS
jgi:hypothetical protein|tara:strand:+ start:822 stop:944 length:123 start_codon:yes stop_codon:yes gene_type:complete